MKERSFPTKQEKSTENEIYMYSYSANTGEQKKEKTTPR